MEDIDLIKLLKTVYLNRRKVILFTLAAGVLGLIIGFISPTKYETSVVFLPVSESEASPAGGLSDVASLVGIDISAGSGEAFSPTLYPKIVESVAFRKLLLEAPVTVEGQKMSYREYYDNVYSLTLLEGTTSFISGLPDIIKGWFGADEDEFPQDLDYVSFDKEELIHLKRLEKQLLLVINDKEGTLSLSFTMPTAILAAEMTDFSGRLLREKLIEMRLVKANDELQYVEGVFEEKRKEFESAHADLAQFQDENFELNTARARIDLQRLQSKYDLAFSLFMEASRQLEAAKIKINKDTPNFTIVDPIFIPHKKAAPRKILIALIFSLLGALICITLVLVKAPVQKIIDQIK